MKSSNISILLIEDDKVLGEVLVQLLKQWGYKPLWISDGEDGLDEALKNKYDLIIADIALPRMNGLAIVDRIKQKKLQVPIIVMTENSTVNNQITTFENGANLFHPKPLNFDLLSAQIKSLIKVFGYDKPFSIGIFQMDPNKRELIHKKKPIKLSVKEFKLLLTLAKHPGFVFSREQLINATFKGNNDKTFGSIDTLISRLRKRVCDLTGNEDQQMLIETVYGVGYRLNEMKK